MIKEDQVTKNNTSARFRYNRQKAEILKKDSVFAFSKASIP